MQDDMEATAPVKGKGGRNAGGKAGGGEGRKSGDKAAGDGPKNPEIQIARMLVRVQWQQEWSAANPDAGQNDRKAAWKDLRQPRMEEHFKSARKVISALARQGVNMTIAEGTAADAGDEAGDDDSDA